MVDVCHMIQNCFFLRFHKSTCVGGSQNHLSCCNIAFKSHALKHHEYPNAELHYLIMNISLWTFSLYIVF